MKTSDCLKIARMLQAEKTYHQEQRAIYSGLFNECAVFFPLIKHATELQDFYQEMAQFHAVCVIAADVRIQSFSNIPD